MFGLQFLLLQIDIDSLEFRDFRFSILTKFSKKKTNKINKRVYKLGICVLAQITYVYSWFFFSILTMKCFILRINKHLEQEWYTIFLLFFLLVMLSLYFFFEAVTVFIVCDCIPSIKIREEHYLNWLLFLYFNK